MPGRQSQFNRLKHSAFTHLLGNEAHSHLRDVLIGLEDLLLPRANDLARKDLVQLPAEPQPAELARSLRLDAVDDGRRGQGLQLVVVAAVKLGGELGVHE